MLNKENNVHVQYESLNKALNILNSMIETIMEFAT